MYALVRAFGQCHEKNVHKTITIAFSHHSRFINTAASAATPVRTKDVKLISWNNFDHGSWPQNTEELPLYKSLLNHKRKREAELLAAQQESPCEHPDKEPYNFREIFAHQRVVALRDQERFFKVVANLDALTRVLQTAPHGIHMRLQRDQRRLEDQTGVLLREVRRLHKLRSCSVLFDHFAFYAKVQVQDYRQILTQKENARQERARKKASVDQVQEGPEPGHTAAPEIALESDKVTPKTPLDQHPELWAITPLSSHIRRAACRPQVFLDLRRQSYMSLRSASVKLHEKILGLLDSANNNIMDMLELDRELRALQHYRIQRCPGSMLGRRVELGKELWAKTH